MKIIEEIDTIARDWDSEAQLEDLTDKVNELVNTVNAILAVLPKEKSHE